MTAIVEKFTHAGKICIWCKKFLPEANFSICRSNKDGRQSRCKSCDNDYNRKRREAIGPEEMRKRWNSDRAKKTNDFNYRLNSLLNVSKQRARLKDREHTLTLDDLKALYPTDGLCPVFGIKLEWNSKGFRETSPSIDRIDSSKGYTLDNVQIISWKANRIKSYATVEELETVLNFMKSGD